MHHDHGMPSGTVGADRLRFLMSFLRKPAMTGSVVPSSAALARATVGGVDLANAETVVELGPGTGSFTKLILERIGKETLFLAMELDEGHTDFLRRKYPRVETYHASAERLPEYLARHGRREADCIISGLPWANMGAGLQDRILRATIGCLSATGTFVAFSYAHGLFLPTSYRFRAKLRQLFREVRRSGVVWNNFPPAVVYFCGGKRAG